MNYESNARGLKVCATIWLSVLSASALISAIVEWALRMGFFVGLASLAGAPAAMWNPNSWTMAPGSAPAAGATSVTSRPAPAAGTSVKCSRNQPRSSEKCGRLKKA